MLTPGGSHSLMYLVACTGFRSLQHLRSYYDWYRLVTVRTHGAVAESVEHWNREFGSRSSQINDFSLSRQALGINRTGPGLVGSISV